jgi:DNA-directed RNA polymerase subunit beta'
MLLWQIQAYSLQGIVCDKCGVEVTRAIVRRERMGHIKLATAGVPYLVSAWCAVQDRSWLGISPQDLER